MARTTYSAVALIIEVDANISTDLAPFIEVANALVTDVCNTTDYTAAKLELIERWLSAHFYAMRDPLAENEKAGEVGQKFFGKVDLGLQHTRYGQMVLILDTDGDLAALNNRATKGRAKVTLSASWLGTEDWDENNNT